jgi:hypothetical protein
MHVRKLFALVLPPLVRVSLIYILLLCAASNPCVAQVLHLESSQSRGVATANITSSGSGTLTVNPALMHADSVHSVSLGLAITPNEQGLSDAYTAAAQAAFFVRPIGVSLSVGAARLAYSTIYSDVDAMLGISKAIRVGAGRQLSVGARFRYESLSFTPEYPPVRFYLLDLGFSFMISDELSMGAVAASLLGSTQRAGDLTLQERPAIFMLGATYHPTDAPVSIFAALEEQDPFPLDAHLGIAYTPVDYLTIRAGTTTDNGTISLGAGILYDPLIIDLAIRFDHSFGSIVTIGLGGKW